MRDFQMINLKKLNNLLSKSKEAHQVYCINSKSFKHAKNIKNVNTEIMFLLDNSAYPTDMSYLLSELKIHLIEWLSFWKAKEEKYSPKDGDEFIFTGYKTYPKKLDKILYNKINDKNIE